MSVKSVLPQPGQGMLFSYPKFEAVAVSYPGSPKVYDGVTFFETSVSAAMEIFDSYQ